jgi:uncharacterized protein (DUF1697 family)
MARQEVSARVVPTFIAMLRGINVGGHKIVKMERLRATFEAQGFGNVRTYVQSGNVVFDGQGVPAKVAEEIAAKIAARIEEEFGFSVPVTVLTGEALGRVVAENPFVKEKGIDPAKLHVTFLSGSAAAEGLKKLGALPAGPDRFSCPTTSTSVYLRCPEGYGNSKLSNLAIEKALALDATTRNWKTVTALHRMAVGQ